MRDEIRARLEELSKRAGLSGVSPAVLGVGFAVLALAVCVGAWRWLPGASGSSTSDGLGGGNSGAVVTDVGGRSGIASSTVRASASTTRTGDSRTEAKIWVHVVGAVRHPGLYRLDPGARVNGAVQAAGGFLGNAAEEGVNLARPLTDGEQLVVPTAEQFAKSGAGAGMGAVAGGGGGAGASPGAPVDINNATAEQLDALPGIGPATATKIVADREAHGPFKSVEDLGRVAGIGPKKLADLGALIVVR